MKLMLSCGACLAAAVLAGCGGSAVSAPKSFKVWNAKDGTFQLEYPEGWEAKGGGRQGVQWARIQKGTAMIYVNVSTTDSVVGDIAGTGMNMVDGALPGAADIPDELKPAAVAHKSNEDRVLDDQKYSDYKEQAGTAYNPPLGEAYRTEFTGKLGMGRKVHGVRATVLGVDKGVTVLCHCNESDWETLQPAFIRILEGMKYGSRQ